MHKAYILLLMALIMTDVFAAPADGNVMNLMKRKLSEQDKTIKKLSSDISRLESRLGEENKKYNKIVEQRKSIELSLYSLDKNLTQQDKSYKDQLSKIQRLVAAFTINSLKQNEDSLSLAQKELLQKGLKEQTEQLLVIKKENQELLSKVTGLQGRLEQFKKLENDVTSFMAELEEEKRLQALSYVKEINTKKELESKELKLAEKFAWSQSKRALGASQEGRNFFPPIIGPRSLENKNKKGVTYIFDGHKQALAPGDGEIVYVGGLSTYGNVVMIDHGQETRSVLLGSFIPKVKKGDKVKVGSSIGDYKNGGKLYFEIRKKNRAQNTLPLIQSSDVLAAQSI